MKTPNLKLDLSCPNCGHPLDDFLIKNFEKSVRADLEQELSRREKELTEQRNEYNQMSLQLVKDKESLDKLVSERVQGHIRTKEAELKESIQKQINEEKALQLQELENELIKKSSLLREMNENKAKLVTLQRTMEERETALILEKENELSVRLAEAKKSIQEQTEQENVLKIREREKIIEDLKTQLSIAIKKSQNHQTSQQLSGEVQEQEIISIIESLFPTDECIQSKKGMNSADILMKVKTISGVEIGSMYIESKRTSAYSKEWIPKLKSDNLRMNSDILILITASLPQGVERYGLVDGVWVCHFNPTAIRELITVLRFGLQKVYSEKLIHQHSDEKMAMLYSYLTSTEFKNLFENILENYRAIEENHQKQQMLLNRLWAEKTKMLQKILANSISWYGAIKGIAGEAIPEIKMLEIPKAS